MDIEQKIEYLADVFSAIGDGNRLRILNLLICRRDCLCVNGIAKAIGISQSAVSQHLKILRQNGLVSVKKEGYFKHYSINKDTLKKVRDIRVLILGKDFEI